VPETGVAGVTAVTNTRAVLGEAPFWSAGDLFHVDLLDGIVRAWDRVVLATGRRTSFAIPATDGSLVMSQDNRIVRDGATLAELPDLGGRQLLNDAKCDGLGRLWVSSYSPTGEPCAGVYLLENGELRQYVDGLVAGNGIAWHGSTMYVADTARGRIDRFTWDPATGPASGEVFARIDPADGQPDGLATDTAGAVWVALFGGGAVRRYDAAGKVDVHVPLPVTCPTSVCFGAEHLYITTSRHRLPPDADEPWAGRLLRMRAPHPGVPVARFGETL
jgi:sugar lactone lactonase YvrE